MLARYLPLSDLQETLPTSQLVSVGALLSRASIRISIDPLSDKDFLASLYEAYRGPDLLMRQHERLRLLNFVPEGVLREAARQMGQSDHGTFEQLRQRIGVFTWGANHHTKTFLNAFGYPEDYLPEPVKQLAQDEVLQAPDAPYRVLHDYQAPIVYRAAEILRTPSGRAMVQMPTGSGKTRTAMEVVASVLNTKGPHRRVLWLAQSEELCEQAIESFSAIWRHVGKYEVRLGRFWGPYAGSLTAPAPHLVVAGFAKLNRLRASSAVTPAFDLVVVDEAHTVLAPTYSETVAWALRLGGAVLGLSATPGRGSGGMAANEALAEFFNGEILGIEYDDDSTDVINFLQRRRVLSRLKREALVTTTRFALTKKEWERLSEEFDYPESLLQRIANDNQRNTILLQRLVRLAKECERILVFSTSVEQSRLLCACMIHQGVRAAHVDGTMSAQVRRAAIGAFRRGETKMLFNYGVLTTGFDVPQIDAVAIMRPTKSPVLYSQMVGRAMRGPAVGGTEEARLIDVLDNIEDYSGGLSAVYEGFSSYWT